MAVVVEGTRAADRAESSASPTHAPSALRPHRLPRCRFQATETANPDSAAGFQETQCVLTPGQRADGGADTLFGRGCLLGGGLGPPCGRSALPAQALGGWTGSVALYSLESLSCPSALQIPDALFLPLSSELGHGWRTDVCLQTRGGSDFCSDMCPENAR